MINAADYGFKKRRRVFIFACKKDSKFGKLMEKNQGDEWLENLVFLKYLK